MRVPLSWLKEYVEIKMPVEKLAERLIMAGMEVAKLDYIGKPSPGGHGLSWDQIYVGKILEVKPHPNADQLTIAVVDCGNGPVESVTGAPNVRVGESGHKVAVAKVGAKLYDGHSTDARIFTVQASVLRGVASQVVLCSEKELGLSDDHSGVMYLDRDARVGSTLSRILGDIVIELELTPNYAHCLSIVGVAREVAALTGQKAIIEKPAWQAKGQPIKGQIELQIKDKDLCSRYSAALIRGVKVGPSPLWMQHRLRLAGQRPINNIVDITNYVMLESGQPLHAFDYEKLRPRAHRKIPTIVVRRAQTGEKLKTLDGLDRDLSDETLLICDGQGPVALAGVMGGAESEVSEQTTHILLESANFQATNNRRTAQRLQLFSEASKRFTRGLPAETTALAATRAAELMRQLAGGTIASGIADLYPVKRKTRTIRITPQEIARILGMRIAVNQIVRVLKSLECKVQATKTAIKVTPPCYRLDLGIDADIIEEIARVIGYENIPMTLLRDNLPPQKRNRSLELEQRVKAILTACGLTEVINYSPTNHESVTKLDPEKKPIDSANYVRIANPMSSEREFMRQSLLNGLLETVGANFRHTDRVAIFEIGRVYLPRLGQMLPDEERRLGIALVGPRSEKSWNGASGELDFFDLKGVIESVLSALSLDQVEFRSEMHPSYHPGRSASVYVAGKKKGSLGELHPIVRDLFDLPKKRVCVAELDLERLLARAGTVVTYEKLPRFPAVDRDIAVILDQGVGAERIQSVIRQNGGAWLTRVTLFDQYTGAQIPAGKKSLAYSLTYQAEDRTLTDEEVNQVHAQVMAAVERELGAQVRAS
jgi:phenylalanyl-tRNA synthetase beta chain